MHTKYDSQSKGQGLVGEMADGYLGSPKGSVSGEVKALIDDINAKRKREYLKIAKQVNKPLDVVELLAAEKARAKTRAGHYVQLDNGRWVKR